MKIKSIHIIAWFSIILLVSSCGSNPADMRMSEMDIIITKWEEKLQNRAVEFNDMVLIQKDITMLDVDSEIFSATYGALSLQQSERIRQLKTRFKALMVK